MERGNRKSDERDIITRQSLIGGSEGFERNGIVRKRMSYKDAYSWTPFDPKNPWLPADGTYLTAQELQKSDTLPRSSPVHEMPEMESIYPPQCCAPRKTPPIH